MRGKPSRNVAVTLLLIASGCGLFAYWGMFTAAGAVHFDEMAGMIPFFIGVAGGLLFLAAAGTWLVARRKS